MLTNIFLAIGMASAMGFGASYKSLDINVVNNNDNINNVVYDDENYSITLSVDEVNDFTFDNLLIYLNSLESNSIFLNTSIQYNEITYNFSSFQYGAFMYTKEAFGISFYHAKWSYLDIMESLDSPLSYSILWDFSSNHSGYDDVKNAIELDIQANTNTNTNNMTTLGTILNDIVQLLVGGIVSMGSGLALGINSFVSSLMVDSGGISIFIGVVAIFGGIALAVALTRRIFSWVESLGARG